MSKQFQNDSNPGGSIYDFWAGNDKADLKRKITDAKVREIQADKHLLMNERSLNVLKETVVEHNETTIILADFARAEKDVRKRRKHYHQTDGFTTPSPGSTIKHSSIEEESSPIKHLSEEESLFIEEEEDEIIIDDVPYEFSFRKWRRFCR
ncbi:unnamed protein product [Rhizophagus irregularis]|uniref:Uncharacterized protein n=1 Tax=Rhizophagus irregularis TaxID=588596 RepID=A0A2I1HNG7_9GLOM|nr:hypothetical protein RhiirA4_484116 [Rhizophagus irregularis]CAB4412054.1 unnamed protein product [Rhizophagus irregularis]CAB4412322.1 unnamed protein product [Rhizophagus irregularis]